VAGHRCFQPWDQTRASIINSDQDEFAVEQCLESQRICVFSIFGHDNLTCQARCLTVFRCFNGSRVLSCMGTTASNNPTFRPRRTSLQVLYVFSTLEKAQRFSDVSLQAPPTEALEYPCTVPQQTPAGKMVAFRCTKHSPCTLTWPHKDDKEAHARLPAPLAVTSR